MKVVFSITIEDDGEEMVLWQGPHDLTCVPAVGDAVSLYGGGFGPTSDVEERTFGVEVGIHLHLAKVKTSRGNVSSSILMGQHWKPDRPHFR